ncbi:hypothetical protein [Burkholderia sp. RS02]|uniref:hypothetical protein n=1 Tax=unclassified Burkholderia TaxID=2613784 RepID=UPI003218BD17
MNAEDLVERAQTAAKDHLKYARFVQDAEIFQADAVQDEKWKSAYRACWFELEIVNALALDDWESSGKPDDWSATWNERYKKDAEELIANLCAILLQQQ